MYDDLYKKQFPVVPNNNILEFHTTIILVDLVYKINSFTLSVYLDSQGQTQDYSKTGILLKSVDLHIL